MNRSRGPRQRLRRGPRCFCEPSGRGKPAYPAPPAQFDTPVFEFDITLMRSATRGQTLSTPKRRPRRRARRGVVCILAMLFLVLFAVLALGFYFSTAMASQV